MPFGSIAPIIVAAHPATTSSPPSGLADGDVIVGWAYSDSTNAQGIIGNTAAALSAPFVVGAVYTIASVGTTNFIAIGAASNTVGVIFTATGVGSGTGTATGGFIPYTGLEVILSSATSDGGTFWSGYRIAASESSNYSITNANAVAMTGGFMRMTGAAATAFINRQILATQQTKQASPWTMTGGTYPTPTDATCDEIFIGFSDNDATGAVVHSTPAGFTMRAGATGQSNGTFINGLVATKDGSVAGAAGGDSCTGTLITASAGWSVLQVAIKQASGGGGTSIEDTLDPAPIARQWTDPQSAMVFI